MAIEKQIKTRFLLKHDIEANWILAAENSGFVPKAGEPIIYDPDEIYDSPRLKIGDGVTIVTNLPFIKAEVMGMFVGTEEEVAGEEFLNAPDGSVWIDPTEKGSTEEAPATEVILASNVEGSSKKFKITIDDNGILTATEIVESTV